MMSVNKSLSSPLMHHGISCVQKNKNRNSSFLHILWSVWTVKLWTVDRELFNVFPRGQFPFLKDSECISPEDEEMESET